MTIRMTILWRCLLWLERLLLLLLLRYYCGTTAVLLLLLLLLLLRYYCGRWSRCARTATAAAACHCCEPSARRRHYLLWLTYYGYTYHGYTCSTLGQAPPLLTMAIPALPAMPTVAVLCCCTLLLYRRCTMAMPTMAILWLSMAIPWRYACRARGLCQVPPEGGLACGGGCDNCATAAREATAARRRPAKLDLSRAAVLAVRLVRGGALTRTLRGRALTLALAPTLTLALALSPAAVLAARLLQPLTAPYCPLLPLAAPCCPLLPLTAPYCPSLPLTAPYCPLLPLTAPHCPSLPLTAPYCRLATPPNVPGARREPNGRRDLLQPDREGAARLEGATNPRRRARPARPNPYPDPDPDPNPSPDPSPSASPSPNVSPNLSPNPDSDADPNPVPDLYANPGQARPAGRVRQPQVALSRGGAAAAAAAGGKARAARGLTPNQPH
jgi:hypothetical protein